jgi:hypothetical protein
MDRKLRTRAHYARLYGRIGSTALPEALAENELSDDRILAAVAPVVPQADARFCREVRRIAAFLNSALTKRPPSEKDLKKELTTVSDAIAKLHESLMRLSDYTRDSLVEFEWIDPVGPPVAASGGAFPPTPASPLDPSPNPDLKTSELEWYEDNPVAGLLVELETFRERLNKRLAERAAGGAPHSPKWFALLLLCDLAHEYKRSCSKSELKALAEASLRYVLALRGDDADLGELAESVVEEVSQMQENRVPN